uniref:Uncharacterized protein n=1 Tax=Setaria italica TaxID=4555 RepID=K3Z164_SETIT
MTSSKTDLPNRKNRKRWIGTVPVPIWPKSSASTVWRPRAAASWRWHLANRLAISSLSSLSC